MASQAASGTIRQLIIKKITERLKPVHLDVINESYMHNVPKGSETHFKVVIVSSLFNDRNLVQRHRIVNDILKDEFTSGLHALSIQAKTPEQWQKNTNVPQSPECLGGSKR